MIFKIKKNKHYSNCLIYKLKNIFNRFNRASYIVTFNETAIYDDTTIDKHDVNKLFGFSNGLHHKNSNRFGWNCLDGKIHIYAYSYLNGDRIIDYICNIGINNQYKFIISNKNNNAIFTVIDSESNITQVIQKTSNNSFLRYNLWPYFGGNKTAPKDIFIELIKY
jgi:hypothetical protein